MSAAVDLAGQARPAWQAHAACAGLDPELFFAERGDISGIRAARAVCARCPVRDACLDQAIADRELGVWGGTTAQERRARRRRLRLVAEGRAR